MEHNRIGEGEITVIIPALNEAENLPWVLSRMPTWIDELLLVDGHSSDGTVALAKKLCPRIKILTQQGKGKGNALKTGFKHATGEIVITIDADGSMDPTEIPRFVQAIQEGCDFAKGSRFIKGGRSEDVTILRYIGNKLLASVACVLYGRQATDVTYGFNALKARRFPIERLCSEGFTIETEMYVKAMKAGMRIREIPSIEYRRRSGTSKLHAVKDGGAILKVMLLERIGKDHVAGGKRQRCDERKR